MPLKEELIMSTVETELKVVLPDGSQRAIKKGDSAADLAKSIAQGLFRRSVGV